MKYIGSLNQRENPNTGINKIFGYKMGLSATIENEYNPDQKILLLTK